MATKPLQACSIENPRAMFESALASVQAVQSKGGSQARTAIAARTRPIAAGLDGRATEKRALTDAARALATLWKLSPHLVR